MGVKGFLGREKSTADGPAVVREGYREDSEVLGTQMTLTKVCLWVSQSF